MAAIQFKAKPVKVYNVDGSEAYTCIPVPQLSQRHCDMAAFHAHAEYSTLKSPVLFNRVLDRIRREVTDGRGYVRLDQLPGNVTVDTSKRLALVTIEV